MSVIIEKVFSALEIYNTYVSGAALPWILMCAGIFMSVYLRFFHLRHPIKVIKQLVSPQKLTNSEKGTSPLKAVTLSLAGTLGAGNIIGVTAAITAGGPGAIFWMWISAICAMPLKYAETLLAVVFRRTQTDSDGKISYFGGAMYYIRDGLRKCGLKNSAALASVFALLCIANSLTTGNIVQVNAAAASLHSVPPLVFGLTFAALTAIVIIGGVSRISDITLRLIPVLSIVYIVLSMYIISINVAKIPAALSLIVSDAFDFGSATSGISAFLLSKSVRYGVSRGILSNEAGCGTAPTAHASANVAHPHTQGCWGIFEVFSDTIVLCSMTALVILISYEDLVLAKSLEGISLAISAYEKYAGAPAAIILTISLLLFAYATVICQSYYGIESINYLTKSKKARKAYLLIFILATILGATISPEKMWSLADFTIATMTIINTMCLLRLSKEVRGRVTVAFEKTPQNF